MVVLALCNAVDAATRNTAVAVDKDAIALAMRRKRNRGEAPVTMPTREWNLVKASSSSLFSLSLLAALSYPRALLVCTRYRS